MAIDPDLLSQAKAAEARVIDAEHAAEVARCDFHRAVRRLQLAGGSLREIADALGLSHQRIHQIVESAGGTRRWRKRSIPREDLLTCSFCGRDQKHVKKLIAGPGVYICNRCAHVAEVVVDPALEPGSVAGFMRQVSPDAAEQCSFCGKDRQRVSAMAAGGNDGAQICSECVALCREIIDEELT
jgi:transcription elongation factor Elf1